MDFAYDSTTEDLRARVEDFFEAQILPSEQIFAAQIEDQFLRALFLQILDALLHVSRFAVRKAIYAHDANSVNLHTGFGSRRLHRTALHADRERSRACA